MRQIDAIFKRSTAIRGLVSLGVLAMLVALPAVEQIPAHAAGGRDPRDPDARLQVIIKSIELTSQYDVFTEGDFTFSLTFSQVIPACVDLVAKTSTCLDLAGTGSFSFGGDKGDTIQLDKYLPAIDGSGWAKNAAIGPDTGIPVWGDKAYRLELQGTETDLGTLEDDDAGTLLWDLSAANGWDLGARTERAVTHASYYGTGGFKAVGTLVEYEIRRMPLPDLTIRNLEVTPTPSIATSHLVCTFVENSGPIDAAAFSVVFRLDSAPLENGISVAPNGLVAGRDTRICAYTTLPGSGQLSATIDDSRSIAEMNELNNWVEEKYTVAAPPPTPTPTVSPLADLSITAIRVTGHESSPVDYCVPGKNDVTITVKNGGSQPAGPSVLRLEVDEDDSDDQRVSTIDAGKSLDVTVENVKLKKGDHTLQAIADAKHSVTEGNEANNTKTITVSCEEQ